jgi:hypothetical protein
MNLKQSFEKLEYVKKAYGTVRWNKPKLVIKYLTYKLFAKKGTEFLLPGPTSTSHPYGWMID